MSTQNTSISTALAQVSKKLDEQYHRYAVFCGLSDPAVWIMYSLCEADDITLTQNDLVSTWFYPKQTINYTVNSLVKRGWISLEQLPGIRNSKALHLTETGKQFCREKIIPLMDAEEVSIQKLTKNEQELLLHLMEKQCTYFEEEIKKIIGE